MELITACTGITLTAEGLRNVGRRIIDTERMINADFGLTRKDDSLPKRYFDDPMPTRKTKGHKIDRNKFQGMLDEYYKHRGWDTEGRVHQKRRQNIDELIALL